MLSLSSPPQAPTRQGWCEMSTHTYGDVAATAYPAEWRDGWSPRPLDPDFVPYDHTEALRADPLFNDDGTALTEPDAPTEAPMYPQDWSTDLPN